jgi:hypothetical protein
VANEAVGERRAERHSRVRLADQRQPHLPQREKTVRNHASNLFDKLGVWSRAQAIVFARDHGFSS